MEAIISRIEPVAYLCAKLLAGYFIFMAVLLIGIEVRLLCKEIYEYALEDREWYREVEACRAINNREAAKERHLQLCAITLLQDHAKKTGLCKRGTPTKWIYLVGLLMIRWSTTDGQPLY